MVNLFVLMPLALLLSLYVVSSASQPRMHGLRGTLETGFLLGLCCVLASLPSVFSRGEYAFLFPQILLFSLTVWYGPAVMAIPLVFACALSLLAPESGMTAAWFGYGLCFLVGVLVHHTERKHAIPATLFVVGALAAFGGTMLFAAGGKQLSLPTIISFLLSAMVAPLSSCLFVWLVRLLEEKGDAAIRLAAVQKQFLSLFGKTPVAMTLSEPENGVLLSANEAFQRMMGYGKQEMLSLGWKGLVCGQDADVWERGMCVPGSEEKRVQVRLRTADGSLLWTEVVMTSFPCCQVQKVLGVVRDITREKEQELRLSYAGCHDTLTGQYNHTAWEEKVRELSIEHEDVPLAVVVGNLHSVSMINSMFGRQVGDQQIKRFTDICADCLPQGGYLARTDGDEVSLLLPRHDARMAEALTERILSRLSCHTVGGMITLSASFGIATTNQVTDDVGAVVEKAEDDLEARRIYDNGEGKGNVVTVILNSLQAKSPREEQHSQRVGDGSAALARAAGLSPRLVSQMRVAGLLHDIGKIGVDEQILNKPGKLDVQEREAVKRHSEIGSRILSSCVQTAPLASWVLAHHERYDGCGYPRGLKGTDIPLCSRILAVVDTWDAMVSDRPYRKALTPDQAAAEIQRVSGTQLDPDLARLFITRVLHRPWAA
jgi:diguanylate cyclase (GGDEF)-like protein/PAS domain S-box-containing protein